MKVDTAILHAPVEDREIETGLGDGVGEQGEVGRAAGGAGGMADLQHAGCVRWRKMDDLTVRGRGGGSVAGAGKDGDFAVFDVEFDPSPFSHDPSTQRLADH